MLENERQAAPPACATDFAADVPEDLRVRADPDQLFRVLSNLVRNAAQAIEAGGSAGAVSVRAREADGRSEIRVSDTGPGLPQKARDNLFQPFRGSVRQGGTGLGLVIAAELVKGHGGALSLDIDATDIQRGVYRVTETIPVAPGTDRLTLLFPQWLPGNHGPRGPLAELVDLRFTANGKALNWQRDPVEVFAFHIDLPASTRAVTARFIHTSPLQKPEGRITMTPEMLNLQWEAVLLYPAGYYVSRIRVAPSVKLPEGWRFAAALDGAVTTGATTRFAETDLETLVDSPLFAGRPVVLSGNPPMMWRDARPLPPSPRSYPGEVTRLDAGGDLTAIARF